MNKKKYCLIFALNTLATAAALVFISAIGVHAADAVDDPVKQPPLKSWSNIISNAAKRFVVLEDFNSAAVLDRETGLVWEKSPATTRGSWYIARSTCIDKTVGGRKGWRLPSVVELASLIDPSVPPNAATTLPTGHPFTNVQSDFDFSWSATTSPNPQGDIGSAWYVAFVSGLVPNTSKDTSLHVWCVRGPMNADVY
jgi:hypothetical protein